MDINEKKLVSKRALMSITLLIMLWLTVMSPALACQSDRGECKDCVVDQMKYGCPKCVPLIHCMARCLWGGSSRAKCVNKCDCNGAKPRLSDCKKCMSRCKCSCVA
ncbi:uncharacterized protein LOC116137581 [Pistacia vera]|uniref:uncharacterized protein LOC116137581 n=1 Tax=Pistacia vera TaxID=55513 RepID=UPI001263DD38|nr:uncharacterized protein LOC116137581 [Pistacia vera]